MHFPEQSPFKFHLHCSRLHVSQNQDHGNCGKVPREQQPRGTSAARVLVHKTQPSQVVPMQNGSGWKHIYYLGASFSPRGTLFLKVSDRWYKFCKSALGRNGGLGLPKGPGQQPLHRGDS